MSYQALLFCADEKLARVVTQVFTELEFNVEPVNEPFSAVKKLMAQHYDAVVVDCENEQNASLLFKSARNSAANQSSLALALVEGQAGVAKAYRIGANLVLTKPINVEQAKGTLRVARGLLRKNADAAGTAAAPSAPPLAPTSAPKPESTPKPAAFTAPPETPMKAGLAFQSEKSIASEDFGNVAHSEPAFAPPQFETAMPAMAASAKPEKASPPVPEPVAASALAEQAPPKIEALPLAPKPAPMAKMSAKPAGFGTFQSAAAAAAPAKEVIAPVKEKAAESELFETSSSKAQRVEEVAAPTFSALDDQAAEGSGGAKKYAGIAAAVALVVALGYFGYTKFGGSNTASQNAMQKSQPVQAPVPNPAASPVSSSAATEPSPVTLAPSTTVASEPVSKPKAGLNSATATKIAAGKEGAAAPEVVTKTFAPAPIHVNTEPAAARAQAPKQALAPADDTAAVLPNPLAVGSANDSTLPSLISTPANLPVAPVGTVRISQGVSQGLLIKKVQPQYPQNARAMRIEGPVQMQALIDKEGKITNVKVVKGQPVLARAAVDAVRQWRYKPYYLDGQPVEIQTEITVMFKLPN